MTASKTEVTKNDTTFELRVPQPRVPKGLFLEGFIVQEQGSHPRVNQHQPEDLSGAVRSLVELGVGRSTLVALATGLGGIEYTCPYDAVTGCWEAWE